MGGVGRGTDLPWHLACKENARIFCKKKWMKSIIFFTYCTNISNVIHYFEGIVYGGLTTLRMIG